MTIVASIPLSSPLKVTVVCNSDVPWSRSTAEYWGDERGLDLDVVELPFGTAVIDSTAGGNAGTFVRSSNEQTWEELFAPIAQSAYAHGSRAIIMGAATPMWLNWRISASQVDTPTLPGQMAQIVGIWRVVEESGVPLPDRALNGSGISWSSGGSGGALSFTEENFPHAPWPSLPQFGLNYNKYGVMLGDQANANREPSIWVRFKVGRLGLDENYWQWVLSGGTSFAVSELAPILRPQPCLTGRLGMPVFHRQGAIIRAFNGDETEAKTLKIINDSLAQEGAIADHKSKPIYIGISTRVQNMTDSRCMACVDILDRAGFDNIRYFTRSITNPGNLEIYAPNSGREFRYVDIPSFTEPRECFMTLGYALHNQRPGDTVADSAGVTGEMIDNLFAFMQGGLFYSGTSFALRHAMRCVKAGGAGGWGALAEPGTRGNPSLLLYALLNGATVAEAYDIAGVDYGRNVNIGDPLYAPFRHETNPGNVEWWAPTGVPPGVQVEQEPLPEFIEAGDVPLTPPPDLIPEPTPSKGLVFGPGLAYRQRSVSARRTYRGTIQR